VTKIFVVVLNEVREGQEQIHSEKSKVLSNAQNLKLGEFDL
jgi:predicted DNA-binding protein